MEKKLVLGLILLIVLILTGSAVFGAKVWVKGAGHGNVTSIPYNYTSDTTTNGGSSNTRVRVMGLKIWASAASEKLSTLNITVYNIHNFATTDFHTLGTDYTSGISVIYDSNADGTVDGVAPLSVSPGWTTVGNANYVGFTFGSGIEALPTSEPANFNYYIQFNASANPTNGSYFNFTLETMDSPITTNNNNTAGAILNATVGSSNLTFDSVLPTVSVSQTKDSDKNGFVDAIIVNFGEIINDNTFNTTGCFRVNTTIGGEVGDVAVSTGETGNDTILYINWTSNQIQYTNTTPIFNYTQNTSCQIKDLAGNLLGSNLNLPTVDGAPPAFWGCNAYDNGNDGKLNNVNCTMSENITSASSVNTNNFTAYVNYGTNSENSALTITAIVNKTKGSDQNNISIIFDNVVIGTGNVSLGYSGNGLLDRKGNLTITNASITVTDSAKPNFLSIVTRDMNSNGFIEGLNITFSENLSVNAGKSMNETTHSCFMVQALQGGSDALIGNWTQTIDSNYVFLNISQQQFTNTTPKLNYTSNGTCSIVDAAGNVMAFFPNTTSSDGAPPVFLTATSYDTNNNGMINRVEFNLSENLTASNSLKFGQVWALYVTYGTPTERRQFVQGVTASAGSSGAGLQNNVTINTNDVLIGTGNMTLVYVTYADGINDTKGNRTVSNLSVSSITDTAVPVIISKSTIDQNKNGYLDAFQLNFSEAIGNYTFGTNKNVFNQSQNFSIGLLGSNISNGTTGAGDICGLTESLCIPPSEIVIDPDADLNGAGGVNDSVIFLNLTSKSRFNFTTGNVVNITYVANSTLVQDLAGNALPNNNTNDNTTDTAAPVFWTATSSDLGKNGALDFINLSVSESLTIGANIKGTWSANVSFGPGTRPLTISSITGNAGAGNATLQLNNGVFGTGTVTLTYVSATGGLNDSNGNLLITNASVTVTDNASAVVLKEETLDQNTNGYIDAIRINFTESVRDNTFTDDSDNITVGSIARQSLTFNSGATLNDDEILLHFNGTTTYNTGNTPNVNLSISLNNVTSNMTDMNGVNISSNTSDELSTDLAAPVFWRGYSEDINKNGALEFINLSFSEALANGTNIKGTWSANVSFGPSTRPLTISSITAATEAGSNGNVTLQLNKLVFGTGTVTLTYVSATGGINDSVGNLVGTNASVTVVDNASAIVFSEQTMDNNTNGYLDTIKVNFSESVQDSSFNDSADNITVGSLARQSLTVSSGASANDDVIYLEFTGTTFNTGNTPSVNFSIGSNNVTSNMTDVNGLNITSNTSVELSTDKAGPVIWSKGTLSFNRTGYLDTINITFSESVTDNTTANLSIEGVSSPLYDTAFPGDGANDAYVYLGFTGTTYFTNGTPTANYSYGGAAGTTDVLKDSAGNKVARNDTTNGAATTDTAPPVLLSAVADDGATASNGVDSDDYIMFTFSEQVNFTQNRAISNTTLNSTKTADAIFYLNATGANWGGGWDANIGRFNNSQNTTLNLTFSNANSNLSAPSIYLIFMNRSVIDMSANAVIQDNKTNVSLTGSFQDVQVPSVSSWWTNDSNANGYIDSIVVTMSETVNNDTGRCGLGWNVSNNVTSQNYSVNTFLSTCDNSTRVNITVTELTVFDTNVTVYVNYSSAIGVVRDTTNNNKLGDSNSSALDKARPVLVNATTFDGDSDGYIDAYNLTFSENVSDSSFNWTGETAPALSGLNFGFSNVTGTKRNDVFFNLNFPDGNVTYTSNATPDLTNSFINDTSGNAMLDLATAGLSEYDNASPVFWTVNGYVNNFTNRSGKDGWLLNTKFRTNQNISIKFNVSENVTQPTVTVGGNAATLVGTTNTTSNLGLGQIQYEYYYVVQGSETEGAVTLSISASDLTGKANMVRSHTNTSQNLTVDYKVTRIPRLTIVDQPQDDGAGLKLNWTANADDDFFRYSFMCNLTNASNLPDLTPVSTSQTIGDTSFTVKSYHDGTNTTLTDGTDYYCVINVSDSVGNVNTSMNVTSLSYANGNVSLTANKWQMIGTPKYLNNTKFNSNGFSTSDSVKYYNATDATWYTFGVSTDRMYQLRGYWIYNYNGLQVNHTYRAATGGVTPESTTLFTGWNLIGSPTNTAGTNVTTKLNNALGSTKWSIIYFWNVSDSAWYYNTPTGEGDLGAFNVDGGYWVSMTSAGNSTVYTGEP